MGEFWDSIEKEVDALENEGGITGASFHGEGHSKFGVEYDADPTVVKQVQAAINALGYTPALTVDGAYGPKTIDGVKWVQAAQGVTPDGIIGDQTLGALGITPPGGTSVGSVTGAAKAALAAIQAEFAPLLSWHTANPQPITAGKGIAPGFNATRATVVNSYIDWTTPLEGFLPFMYIDTLGWVTTGMGNLIDPVSMALALPWKNADGSPASQQQIIDTWNAVDSQRSTTKGQTQSGVGAQGGGRQGGVTSIRITKADVQNAVAAKMKSNEASMLQGLPNFHLAPAPAQLATHSMAWAMGPGLAIPGNSKAFPAFMAAFNAGDYAGAAAQSHVQGASSIRNMANKLLLTNAANPTALKNPDVLYYIDNLVDLFTPSSKTLIIAASIGGLLLAAGTAYILTRGA